MKVFATGHQGYIGAHLVDLLKEAGHAVTGCDIGLFDGCHWEEPVAPDAHLSKDVRLLSAQDLEGHDCIMHLAAISNDPMGELDASLTASINRDASVRLAQLAKQAGVPRFLFASSCSVYGASGSEARKEGDPLAPLSAYARSKIETEQLVSELADKDFAPAYLRNATAYGDSPMLRIDLVANNLLGSALAHGEVRILSDGTPWRPLIHCRDIARAMVAFMDAPADAIRNRAVNVGANDENHQVRDIADRAARLVPEAQIAYTGEVGADPRDYRVSFDLLGELLPDFRLAYPLDAGMEELCSRMRERKFSLADFEGKKYVRLRMLNDRMHLLAGAA